MDALSTIHIKDQVIFQLTLVTTSSVLSVVFTAFWVLYVANAHFSVTLSGPTPAPRALKS